MINEFDRVRIKATGIIGDVVDIYIVNEITYYAVESDDNFELYKCLEPEIEKIS